MESIPDDILAVIFELILCTTFENSNKIPLYIVTVCKKWYWAFINKCSTLGSHRFVEFGNISQSFRMFFPAPWNIVHKMQQLADLNVSIQPTQNYTLQSKILALCQKPSIKHLKIKLGTAQYNNTLAQFIPPNLESLTIDANFYTCQGLTTFHSLKKLKHLKVIVEITPSSKSGYRKKEENLDFCFVCPNLESLHIEVCNNVQLDVDCSLFPKLRSIHADSVQINNVDKCPYLEHIFWKQNGQNREPDFGLVYCQTKSKQFEISRKHWDIAECFFPKYLTSITIDNMSDHFDGRPSFRNQGLELYFLRLFPKWLFSYQSTIQELNLYGIPMNYDETNMAIFEKEWLPVIIQLPLTHITLTLSGLGDRKFDAKICLEILTNIITLQSYRIFGFCDQPLGNEGQTNDKEHNIQQCKFILEQIK